MKRSSVCAVLPVEGEAHHRHKQDGENHAGPDDYGDADHDGGVLQLLLPHGGHQDPVTVTGDYQGVDLRQILILILILMINIYELNNNRNNR